MKVPKSRRPRRYIDPKHYLDAQSFLDRQPMIIQPRLGVEGEMANMRNWLLARHVPLVERDGSLLIAPRNTENAWMRLRTTAYKRRVSIHMLGYALTPGPEELAIISKPRIRVKVGHLLTIDRQNDNRWLYVIRDGDVVLYVGASDNTFYPTKRVSQHFSDGVLRDPGSFRQYVNDFREAGGSTVDWTVDLFTPADCDPITLRSYFLPGEDYATIIPTLVQEYRDRVRADPTSNLLRAEQAFIVILRPRYNISGRV